MQISYTFWLEICIELSALTNKTCIVIQKYFLHFPTVQEKIKSQWWTVRIEVIEYINTEELNEYILSGHKEQKQQKIEVLDAITLKVLDHFYLKPFLLHAIWVVNFFLPAPFPVFILNAD